MKVKPIAEHEQKSVEMDGAQGVRMRMLIGPAENAPNFHMRHFEVEPGGNSPQHAHDYEHEILILKGEGVAVSDKGDLPLRSGTVVYVAPNENHCLRNTGAEPLEFICLIPAPEDCTR